jgi:hypothetical protein
MRALLRPVLPAVDSPADVARAIQIAFEQDELYEVMSTLQLRSRESSGGVK